VPIELSYCVVNTEQRQLLRYCLDAIARERAAVPFETEVIVLDNASRDGSAGTARAHGATTEVIALEQRRGKGENDSTLLRRARGRYVLLLNDDAELEPGATMALHEALAARPRAAVAGATLVTHAGRQEPSAWRFPGPLTALLTSLYLHRRFVVQSRGSEIRRVDWVQSAALLVRHDAAEAVGYLDPAFFVFSDEVDFCKRLRDAGWHTLYVPQAVAVHHEQLSTGGVPERRIVEFSRNRDLYLRVHHGAAAALAVRWLTALPYALRAIAALVLPGHDPRRYARHVTATLRPGRGDGIREAAEAFNAARDAAAPPRPPAPPQ
jgi:N-acetylglucosaminyl-diphospho-decaprenol L-rhamnosyltransferase